MLEPGTQAPDFTLPNQDGEPVALSALRGETVVVYFYPKADTPGQNRSTEAAHPGQQWHWRAVRPFAGWDVAMLASAAQHP
jgi:hypothetical protein